MGQEGSTNLFVRNRTKLAALLDDDALCVVFSNQKMPRNGDQFYSFRQNSDFYYLTGIEEEESILLLDQNQALLFIPETSEQKALWEGPRLTREKAETISGIGQIERLEAFEKTLEKRVTGKKCMYLNLPLKIATTGIKSRDELFLDKFRAQYPFHGVRSLKPALSKLRLIKEPTELKAIRKAISITEQAFLRVLSILEPGMPEKTVEAEITRELIRNRAQGFAFEPIIASGKNATVLHYTNNSDTCRANELLLMDFGAEYNNYAADISRTLPVNGQFSRRQKACYQAVLDVMEKAMEEIKPGVTIESLNKSIVKALTEKHLELGLYKERDLQDNGDQQWKKYFPHGVSHFMGLDVHDTGDKKTPLEKGMVISWEPGLYIPEEHIGIRIEDDILVDDKPVNLSSSIPKDPEHLESLMQQSKTG
jgi:Xaa-Pro aminopeptidase